MKSVATLVLSFAAIADAAAQTVGQTVAAGQPAIVPASPMASMLQGMVGLAIVVALIFVAGWVLRKIGPRARSTGAVQVIGGASVGPREKVVVVKFGQQTLLLGVASGHVSLLHAATPEDLVDAPASTTPAAPRFIDRLRAARGEA